LSSAAFDYVIVGAGSAGCVLANRLSEDPDVRVAVLEAGGRDTAQEIQMASGYVFLFKTSVDWDLFGEPEPGLGGRRLYLPRGRVLGGSSSINAQIYIRGNRADYDGWDIDGWRYDDVLPYFKRAEDNERGEDTFHGVGGPLAVSDGRSGHPLVTAMVEATKAAGHEFNPDFNGARQEGVGPFQLTQREGARCSAAAAYLHPAERRPNLTAMTGAMAARIVFDGERATGVELLDGEVVRAEREVIVSAGTYQSPVLLMLSGIGPAKDLELAMVDVRVDLPVGENLQDHLMAQLNYLTDVPSLSAAFTPENLELLEAEQRGPLTSNIPEAGGFFRTRAGLDAPDVEFHYAPAMFFDQGLTPPLDDAYTFGPVVIKPTSRGKVSLRAPVPDAKPRGAAQLPDHRGGPGEHDRRRADGAGDRAPSAAAGGGARAIPRARVRLRRGHHGLRPALRAHRLPPHVELCDGRGGGRGAARLRLRGPARGRRVGDAVDHAREHERADDHDRGAGR
jgi:choline dehydrogenase-like flavoprotein